MPDAPPAAGMQGQLDEANAIAHLPAALMAAALKINKLSLQEGYEQLDQDNDGRLSLEDLKTSCEILQLGIEDEAVRQYHDEMDTNKDGFVDLHEWLEAMRNPVGMQDVLKSRGLALEDSESGAGTDLETGASKSPAEAINIIAACLVFNNLTASAGYRAFDVDEDDRVSLADLQTAVTQLELELKPEEVVALYKDLDSRNAGYVQEEDWKRMIEGADPSGVLQSRGLPVATSTPSIQSEGLTGSQGSELNTGEQGTPRSLISAALQLNNLTLEEGFTEFDVDKDGLISLDDLRTAASVLQLRLDDSKVQAVHGAMDANRDGKVTLTSWLKGLESADGTKILESRGINLQEREALTQASVGKQQASATLDTPSAGPDMSQSPAFQNAANIIAAALGYNKLSAEEGYESFDADEDGRVSFQDLQHAAETLSLDLPVEDLRVFHGQLDVERTGFINQDAWVRALTNADIDDILRSRGIPNGEEPLGTGSEAQLDSQPLSSAASLQTAIDILAAALSYNNLTAEMGYESFDADEDGKVSLADLEAAVDILRLNIDKSSINRLFDHMDANKTGFIPKDVWVRLLNDANADDILRSRGVFQGEEPTGVESEKSVSELLYTERGDGWLQYSIDTIAAALVYNSLNAEEGYAAFDADADGLVSFKDMREAIETLKLDISPAQMQALFTHLSRGGEAIDKAIWTQAIESAQATDVLRSRGVVDQEAVRMSINTIAAALTYNKLSWEEGYKAFDDDGDGRISEKDMRAAVDALVLDISDSAFQDLFAFLDDTRSGFIELPAWTTAMSTAQADEVLKSRGISSEGQTLTTGSSVNEVDSVRDAVAAVLAFNQLSVDEGYEAMDEDQDSKVSLNDMLTATRNLQLNVTARAVEAFFTYHDPQRTGYLSREAWADALKHADADRVGALLLESKGVDSQGTSASIDDGTPQGGVPHEPVQTTQVTDQSDARDRAPHAHEDEATKQEEAPETSAQSHPAHEQPAHEQPAQPPSDEEEKVEARQELTKEVQESINTLAAALLYNNCNPSIAHILADVDGDGKISAKDFDETMEQLSLNLSQSQVKAMFNYMKANDSDFIDRDIWISALSHADATEVMKSVGMVEPRSPLLEVMEKVRHSSYMVAAALRYNSMYIEDGFDFVDADKDGKISVEDLRQAVRLLHLERDLSEAEVSKLHASLDISSTGYISKDVWFQVMHAAPSAELVEAKDIPPQADQGHAHDNASHDVAGLIAALLSCNRVPDFSTGYTIFDKDADGKVNLADLLASAEAYTLSASEDDIKAWFSLLDSEKTGSIPLAAWISALESADPEPHLSSRGLEVPANTRAADSVDESEGAKPSSGSHVGGGVHVDAAQSHINANNLVPSLILAVQKLNVTSVEGLFQVFDCDQDGSISLQDLKQGASKFKLMASEQDLVAFHQAANKSASGKLSMDEWRQALLATSEVVEMLGFATQHLAILVEALDFNQTSIRDGFDSFDVDRDGRLSKQDLEQSLQELNMQLSAAEIDSLHKMLDLDKDGYVSLQEWEQVLQPFSSGASSAIDNSLEAMVAGVVNRMVESCATILKEEWAAIKIQANMRGMHARRNRRAAKPAVVKSEQTTTKEEKEVVAVEETKVVVEETKVVVVEEKQVTVEQVEQQVDETEQRAGEEEEEELDEDVEELDEEVQELDEDVQGEDQDTGSSREMTAERAAVLIQAQARGRQARKSFHKKKNRHSKTQVKPRSDSAPKVTVGTAKDRNFIGAISSKGSAPSIIPAATVEKEPIIPASAPVVVQQEVVIPHKAPITDSLTSAPASNQNSVIAASTSNTVVSKASDKSLDAPHSESAAVLMDKIAFMSFTLDTNFDEWTSSTSNFKELEVAIAACAGLDVDHVRLLQLHRGGMIAQVVLYCADKDAVCAQIKKHVESGMLRKHHVTKCNGDKVDTTPNMYEEEMVRLSQVHKQAQKELELAKNNLIAVQAQLDATKQDLMNSQAVTLRAESALLLQTPVDTSSLTKNLEEATQRIRELESELRLVKEPWLAQDSRMQKASSLISACLLFNRLGIHDGFLAFDQDHDDLISLDDMKISIQELALEDFEGVLMYFHECADRSKTGMLTEQDWTEALTLARVQNLIRTNVGSGSETVLSDEELVSLVGVALLLNHLSIDSGFQTFDADEDGELSLNDMQVTAAKFELRLSQEELGKLHKYLAKGGEFVSLHDWTEKLSGTKLDEMQSPLNSRGVDPAQSRDSHSKKIAAIDTQQVDLLTTKNAELERQVKEAHATVSTLELQVKQSAAKASVEMQLKEANATISNLEMQVKESATKTSDFELQLKEATATISSLQLQIDDSATKVSNLQRDLTQAEEDKEGLKRQLESKSADQNAMHVQEATTDVDVRVKETAEKLGKEPSIQEDAGTSHAYAVQSPVDRLQHMVNIITSSLVYNRLSVEEGFAVFDHDGDGLISRADVEVTSKQLLVGDALMDLIDLAKEQTNKDALDMDAWKLVLTSKHSGERNEILEHVKAVLVEARKHADMRDNLSLIAATLVFNGISHREGFDVFDVNGDGMVCIEDLRQTMHALQMDVSDDVLRELVNFLGKSEDGKITPEEWEQGMENALTQHAFKQVKAYIKEEDKVDDKSASSVSTELGVLATAIAACLTYNRLNIEEGFDAFDKDGDGRISQDDLQATASQLNMGDQWARFVPLAKVGDSESVGPVEWKMALLQADWYTVLSAIRTSLVRNDEQLKIDECIGMIAAALFFNHQSAEDGFGAFDADKDGMLSVDDLKVSVRKLELGLSDDEVTEVHKSMNDSKTGYVSQVEWTKMLNSADVNMNSVLRSRYFELVKHQSAHTIATVAVHAQEGDSSEDRLKHMGTLISASLAFNHLDADEGFAAFDHDGDGLISSGDMDATSQRLRLDDMLADLVPLAARGKAGLDRDDWNRVLRLSDWKNTAGSMSEVVAQHAEMHKMLSIFAASLAFNNLTVEQGFGVYDADGDGKLSVSDLKATAKELQLLMDAEDITAVHSFLNKSGSGFITQEEWESEMRNVDITQALATRNLVDLTAWDESVRQLEKAQAEKAELTKLVDSLRESIKELEVKLETMKQPQTPQVDTNELEEKLKREMMSESQALKDKIKELEDKAKDEMKHVQAHEAKIKEWEDKVNEEVKQSLALKTKIQELEEKTKQDMEQLQAYQAKIQELEGNAKKDMEQLQVHEAKIKEIEARLKHEMTQSHALETSLSQTLSTANLLEQSLLNNTDAASQRMSAVPEEASPRDVVVPSSGAADESAALRDKIQELTSKIDDLESSVSSLNEAKAANAQLNISLNEQMELVKARNEDIEKMTSQHKAEVEALVKKEAEWTVQQNWMKVEMERLQVDIERLRREHRDAAAKLADAEVVNVQVQALITENDCLKSALDAIRPELDNALAINGDIELQMKEATEAAALSETLKARVSELQAEVQQGEKKLEASMKQLRETERELESLREPKPSPPTTDFPASSMDVAKLREQLQEALKKNNESDMEVARLGVKLQELVDARMDDITVKELQVNLTLATERFEACEERTRKVETAWMRSTEELQKKLQATEEQLQIKESMMRQELAKLQKDLDDATARKQSLENESAQYKSKYKEAAQAESDLVQARKDLSEALARANAATRDVQEAQLKYVSEHALVQALEMRLSEGSVVAKRSAEEEEHVKKLEIDKATLSAEVERLKIDLDKEVVKCEEARKEIAGMEKELAQAKAKLEMHYQLEEAHKAMHKAKLDAAEAEKETLRQQVLTMQRDLTASASTSMVAGSEFRKNLEEALAEKARVEIELFRQKDAYTVMRTKLDEAVAAISSRPVEVKSGLSGNVQELSSKVVLLVEECKAVAEEVRKQRDELRTAEQVRRDLEAKVRSLEGEVAQTEKKTIMSDTWRNQIVGKYADAEQALRTIETELDVARHEKVGFESVCARLAEEVADLRVKLRILETDSEAGSPSRASPKTREHQHLDDETVPRLRDEIKHLQQLLELEKARRQRAEERVKQLEAHMDRRQGGEGDALLADARRQLAEAQDRLMDAERQRDELARRVGQHHDGAVGAGGSAETQRDAQERNARMRQLLKENAEWRAQVRQLSTEVVGLTEALEMVTKRAQDKDAKHAEMQKKTDRILRLAGLVDTALIHDGQMMMMQQQQQQHEAVSVLQPKKKKKKVSSSRARQSSPSPGRSRSPGRAVQRSTWTNEMVAVTPPRMVVHARDHAQAQQQWHSEGVETSSSVMVDDIKMFPTVMTTRPALEGSLRPASAGRQRPQSARARIEDARQDGMARDAAVSLAWQEGSVRKDVRMEYLPPATRGGELTIQSRRPVSASAGTGPHPPDTPPPFGGAKAGSIWRQSSSVMERRGGEGLMGTMGGEQMLRPFSYLVRAVQEGTLTATTPLRIIVEVCNSEHYSRRHDIARYQQLYERVAAAMYEQLRGRIVVMSPNGKGPGASDTQQFEPRPGSFEVCVEWVGRDGVTHTVVLFSKLETMRYPNPANLAARLRVVLAGGDDPDMNASSLIGDAEALP